MCIKVVASQTWNIFWDTVYIDQHLLLNSWPLWAVEASDDPSPLFSICRQPRHFRQGRPHHFTISSTHLFGGLPLKKLPLLYNVHDREISLHSVPDAIVGNLVFPAYFQYPSVTAHLKCQNSDQTAYSFISFSSTFAFILVEPTVRKPVHAKLGKTCWLVLSLSSTKVFCDSSGTGQFSFCRTLALFATELQLLKRRVKLLAVKLLLLQIMCWSIFGV